VSGPFPRRCYGEALKPFVPEGYRLLVGDNVERELPDQPNMLIGRSIIRADDGKPLGVWVDGTWRRLDMWRGGKLIGSFELTGNFARDRARLIALLWPVDGYLE